MTWLSRGWNALQPSLKGAGDQIGRDWSQLRQGNVPSGPTLGQAAGQVRNDLGNAWQNTRQAADIAGADTRAAFNQAQQGRLATPAVTGMNGIGAPGLPGQAPPGGAKGRAPSVPGAAPQAAMPAAPYLPQGAMPPGMGQMPPQGAKGGNPAMQQAAIQAAALRAQQPGQAQTMPTAPGAYTR